MWRRNSLFFLFLCLSSLLATTYIQRRPSDYSEIHLEDFAKKKFHFGFFVAPNYAFYRVDQVFSAPYQGSVVEWVQQSGQFGFSVGLIGQYRFSHWINLRFSPDFSLETRYLYFLLSNDNILEQKLLFNTFYLPLTFRVEAMRLGNFGMHFSFGAGARIDISRRQALDQFLLLYPATAFVSLGVGADSYFEFFKMGFELRLDLGVGPAYQKNGADLQPSVSNLQWGSLRFLISFEG